MAKESARGPTPTQLSIATRAGTPSKRRKGSQLGVDTTAVGAWADKKLKPVFGLDKTMWIKAHFVAYSARHARRPPVEASSSWFHGEAAQTPPIAAAGNA